MATNTQLTKAEEACVFALAEDTLGLGLTPIEGWLEVANTYEQHVPVQVGSETELQLQDKTVTIHNELQGQELWDALNTILLGNSLLIKFEAENAPPSVGSIRVRVRTQAGTDTLVSLRRSAPNVFESSLALSSIISPEPGFAWVDETEDDHPGVVGPPLPDSDSLAFEAWRKSKGEVALGRGGIPASDKNDPTRIRQVSWQDPNFNLEDRVVSTSLEVGRSLGHQVVSVAIDDPLVASINPSRIIEEYEVRFRVEQQATSYFFSGHGVSSQGKLAGTQTLPWRFGNEAESERTIRPGDWAENVNLMVFNACALLEVNDYNSIRGEQRDASGNLDIEEDRAGKYLDVATGSAREKNVLGFTHYSPTFPSENEHVTKFIEVVEDPTGTPLENAGQPQERNTVMAWLFANSSTRTDASAAWRKDGFYYVRFGRAPIREALSHWMFDWSTLAGQQCSCLGI